MCKMSALLLDRHLHLLGRRARGRLGRGARRRAAVLREDVAHPQDEEQRRHEAAADDATDAAGAAAALLIVVVLGGTVAAAAGLVGGRSRGRRGATPWSRGGLDAGDVRSAGVARVARGAVGIGGGAATGALAAAPDALGRRGGRAVGGRPREGGARRGNPARRVHAGKIGDARGDGAELLNLEKEAHVEATPPDVSMPAK